MNKMIEMLKDNKKAVIGVIILVIIAGLLVNALVKKDKAPIDTTPIEEVTPEVPAPVVKKPTSRSNPAVVTDNRSYTEIVDAYKGRTIQFDEGCKAPIFPQQQVFKTGTDILLDNRSEKAATIRFAGATIELAGYRFKVVSLDREGLFTVDCNAQQNVTTINVQK